MERKQPTGPRGPRPIGDAIRSFLKESGLRQPARDERVFRAWSDAVGSDWSRRAIPVSYRSGQLTIEVDSSVHLQELKNFRGEGGGIAHVFRARERVARQPRASPTRRGKARRRRVLAEKHSEEPQRSQGASG